MIAGLVEEAMRRAAAADAVRATDDTLVVRLDGGRLAAAESHRDVTVSLRVLAEGRIGHAARAGSDLDGLLDDAVRSAAHGPELALLLPAPSIVPRVVTHVPRAEAAGVGELAALGARLHERLAGGEAAVTVHVERTAGVVALANSRGVELRGERSACSVEAEVRRGGRTRRAAWSGIDLPDDAALDALAARLRRRDAWDAQPAAAPSASVSRVVLMPDAVAAFLSPLRHALLGDAVLEGASAAAERMGTDWLSPAITLWDDPHVEGRPASRAFDDEGVVTWPQRLVDQGRPAALIADLETATRLGRPATGHARRHAGARPRAGYSSLLLEGGAFAEAELLAEAGDAVLVGALAAGGTARHGSFSLPVADAWLLRAGEVVGPTGPVTVAGNVFEALREVVAVGREREWVGSQCLPMLALEGVRVFPARAG